MTRDDFDYYRKAIMRGSYYRIVPMRGRCYFEILDYTDQWLGAECSNDDVLALLSGITCKSVPGEV